MRKWSFLRHWFLSVGVLLWACNDGGGKPRPADGRDASPTSNPSDAAGADGGEDTPDDEPSGTQDPDSGASGADASMGDDDVGDDAPDSVVQRIEASEGGTITSGDGVFSLSIPAGALAQDTEISVRRLVMAEWPSEVDEGLVVGDVYEVEPDGLRFQLPATVRFVWSDAPERLVPGEDSVELPVLWSYGEEPGAELIELDELHFGSSSGDSGFSVQLAANVEHLSAKWVSATNRGCTLSAAAATGTFYVGDSWTATAFEFDCASGAADSVETVSPLASTSSSAIVGVAFPSSTEGDRLLTQFSSDFWRPGAARSPDALPVELEKPTWTCLAEGDATIGVGAVIQRAGHPIAVTREVGPVECVLCELSQEDCRNDEVFTLSECACECPHEADYQCENRDQRFDAELCDCVCTNECPSANQERNPETCECECTLSEEECGPVHHVEADICECRCNQRQNCSGATPVFNEETCACECNLGAADCESPHEFSDADCACRCPQQIEGDLGCTDLEYFDQDRCECVCIDEDLEYFTAYCADENRRYDPELCDCVCDLGPEDCTGNFRFDEPFCACYCPAGEHRNCDDGYVFDEEVCDCVCDVGQSCPEDHQLNEQTCQCECALDAESCLPTETVNTETCECDCTNPPSCESPMAVDLETCACACDPALPACETGFARNPETCECECQQVSCELPTPHFDFETCACVCDLDQLNCEAPTPVPYQPECRCVSSVFYYLEDEPIQFGPGCDDADGEVSIQNVTETGFELVGLANNPPIPFELIDSLSATGSGFAQFGAPNHTGILSILSGAAPGQASGTFSASNPSGGSCQSPILLEQ